MVEIWDMLVVVEEAKLVFAVVCNVVVVLFSGGTFFSNDETEPSTENYRTILWEKDPAEGHHGSRLMTGFLSHPTALTYTFVAPDIPLATPDRKVRSHTFPRLPKLFPYVDYQSLREG